MPFLIGTDEAGYGPNLGPLVVGASVWQLPQETRAEELYQLLKHCVCVQPDKQRVAIADSKVLYKPGLGLAALERVVLAVLAQRGRPIGGWDSLWPALAGIQASDLACHAWHEGFALSLPRDAAVEDIAQSSAALCSGLDGAGVRIASLQARAVFPDRFNAQVHECGNKAEVLSLTTLRLIADLLDEVPIGNDVIVTCDKHGGRDYYAALIQHVFPDTWVRAVREGPAESVYRFSCENRRIELRFLMGGERMLPTALASMAAKYLREVAMIPFNAFWQRHVPGLKATAGYPSDSRRFLEEIRPACQRLGLAEETFWRRV
jgi:ribonuclease HII